MSRHLLFAWTVAVVVLVATPAAQWLNHPTPGIPRLPDGKPNLNAPAPRPLTGGRT